MLETPPVVDYYTRAAAAEALGWSKQRVWLLVLSKTIACVTTLGAKSVVLIPASEIKRMKKERKP